MNEYLWPESRLNEAVHALAIESGLLPPTRNEKRETRNEEIPAPENGPRDHRRGLRFLDHRS